MNTPSEEEIVLVFCTAPDLETARRLARMAVEQRLAACANLAPGLTSIYTWEDALHEEREALILFKTRASCFEALAAALVKAHPYQVPEVLAVPAARIHGPYRDWVLAGSGA